jgi:peptidoglycan/LPS O-acetylase OafA/YrhL
VFLISSLILHISLLLFGARYLYTEILEGVIFYSPLTRAWEFILGGLVSWSKANHKKLNFSIPAKLSLLFFVFYILFFKNVNSNIALLISTLGLLLAVSLIICDDSLLDYSIIGKSLIFLGNRSYSVYLWHMPIGYLLTYNFDGRISEIALFAMYMAITLLLSQITFSLVEFRFIARGIEKRETV